MLILGISLSGLLLSGCETLMQAITKPARSTAAIYAGVAGKFRVATGRWPSMPELEEALCMRRRAHAIGIEPAMFCEDVVKSPLRFALVPRSQDFLRLNVADRAGKSLCRLTVRIPPPSARDELFPRVIIKTSVFACPGGVEGKTVEIE